MATTQINVLTALLVANEINLSLNGQPNHYILEAETRTVLINC